MKNTPVTTALIGAGNRGRGIFGQYALDNPHHARFVAVAEPDDSKRKAFAEAHGIAPERCFAHYSDLFRQPRKIAEAVVIATWENERVAPALAAMAAGYDILMEKPMGKDIREVIKLTDAAAQFPGVFIVCHQMRYTSWYRTVKELIDSGAYGRVLAIQHSELLSFEHMAHSFVRGFFNSHRLSPLLLAKCCHDLDLLCFFVGARPARVSSFGSLRYFRAENAPAGAPAHCLDGCPAENTCPYHAQKVYLDDDADPAYIRQMGVVRSKSDLMELLRTNRFGRCVFRCDNDVVDNQTVQVEFANGVNASFCLFGLNATDRWITRLSLENGEIEVDLSQPRVRAYKFSPATRNDIELLDIKGTHAGGDRLIMDRFVDAVRSHDKKNLLTSVAAALDSHLLVFAAEEARRTGQVVDIAAYEAAMRR